MYGEHVASLINSMGDEIYHAVTYLSEKETVKVTRKRFKGKVVKGSREFIATIGKPNYASRLKIKQLKKAKCPFPVRFAEFKKVKSNPAKGRK